MGNLLEARFKIIEARECPLYASGEELSLSGLALQPPQGKPTCLFLAREITAIVVERMEADTISPGEQKTGQDTSEGREFNCSGCTGLIKFMHMREPKFFTPQMRMLAASENREQTRLMGSLFSMMNSFSFFRALEESSLKEIIACLVMEEVEAERVILRHGQPGRFLYFLVSGRVAVEGEAGMPMAVLGRGEIFGEMSLFSGKPAYATIRTLESVKILKLSGKDLSHILIRHPFLQMAFTRLLVQRLSSTNLNQFEQATKAFSGRLTELAPAEIYQLIHENVKSGVVTLQGEGGTATLSFSDGEVVRADCDGLHGAAAFSASLRRQQGSFTFTPSLSLEEMGAKPIAPFMKLLMDGLREIDEGRAVS